MITEQTPLLPASQQESAWTWTVVGGVASIWTVSFLAAAETTLTSTLAATIANEFHSLSVISWLGSGYLIALTATQPLYGKLSDIFGRKESFVSACFMFAIGNLVCGLAGSQSTLILGRVLAGIGGGGCNSVSTFILSDYISPRQRGIWQAAGMVVSVLGTGSGAVIGGGFNDSLGWRWAFLVLGPIATLTSISAAVFLPQTPSTTDKGSFRQQLSRVDYAGSFTLVSSLTLVLICLNQKNEDFQALTSMVTITFLAYIAGFLFIWFIVIELCWAQEPIVPLTLFCSPTIVATCLCGLFTSMASFALMFYFPYYLQLRGYSTTLTGIRLLPESIGGGLGSLVTGLLASLNGNYNALKLIAPLIMLLASVGFTSLSFDTPSVVPEVYLFLHGFGYGAVLTVILLAVLSAVPYKQQAVSTSLLLAFRSIGATVGVSVAGIVFRSHLHYHTALNTPSSHTDSAARHGHIHGHGHGRRHTYEHGIHHDSRDSYMYAVHTTFQLALGFVVAGFLCAVFIKNHKLRSSFE